ncbi:MAG: hypothetical protein P4N24_06300, partial [Acidobacteriota bacterium]|nr:hypothetical protein [Acidobacteriota bacterium]
MTRAIDRERSPAFSSPGCGAYRFDKSPAKALTRKQVGAAKSAGGDKLQLAGFKMASIDRHTETISGLDQKRESQGWARPAPAGLDVEMSTDDQYHSRTVYEDALHGKRHSSSVPYYA